MLRSYWWLFTDGSGRTNDPISKSQRGQVEEYEGADRFILADGTDRPHQNVGDQLPINPV
jgi:hypothetical protein